MRSPKAKRAFDFVVSAMALLILAVPFTIIMVVLRLTGEGKVWYLQKRVGQDGTLFRVYKFVTMLENSEVTGTKHITLPGDSRVLPVGRLLRKAKVNELPQLINVLKGDMSIVGWRPLMPDGFAFYPQHVRERIIRGKPGLTGLGSIMFRDEEAIVARSAKDPYDVYREDIAPYKGELELWYQEHQSMWLDLKILIATIQVVLFPTSQRYRRWFSGLPPVPDALLPERGLEEDAVVPKRAHV
jgi:lipopolysaccharide/colanic/teichoic acid biosynthesis glycosyltransferase